MSTDETQMQKGSAFSLFDPCSSVATSLLLITIVVLFAVRNLPWHLDNFDQAKQAYTSFEMVTQGEWWFQHTPTQNVATKPPLAGWISAALFYAAHWWNGAWRIPPFLSALAILFVLKRAGDRIWPPLGGPLAVSVFGLNLMAPRLATLVRTDMLLTLFIFLTGYVIYEKVRTGSPWTTRERGTLCALVLGSMMTKGPIAYAFLLPGLLAFTLICRGRGEPGNAWSGWWSWFAPLLIFAAWAGIGIASDRNFYEQVVVKEFLGRFTVGEQAVHKNQPLYFYCTHMLRDFAPWSLALLVLPFFKQVRRGFATHRAALWLACWSLGGLFVMSLVPSKRPDRIFPIIPPLCLLLVYFVRNLPTSGWPLRRLVWSWIGIGLLSSGGYTIWNLVDAMRDHDDCLVTFSARVRDYTQRHQLRWKVANSKDEGLLLYLNELTFTKFRLAEELWQTGQIDALVLNEQDFAANTASLQSWFLADASGRGAEKNSQYFLIVRSSLP